MVGHGGRIRAEGRADESSDDGAASGVVTGPRKASTMDRPELAATNAFIERTANEMDRISLAEWIEAQLVERGWMPTPTSIYEHGIGAVLLDGRKTRGTETGPLVTTARERVIAAARGLLARPPKDGFVVASLVRGRVRRLSHDGSYAPNPSTADALSDIVLSLLACDVLKHREQYDASLRVCDRCDLISFVPAHQRCPGCDEISSSVAY
jgi:hypothetical protein